MKDLKILLEVDSINSKIKVNYEENEFLSTNGIILDGIKYIVKSRTLYHKMIGNKTVPFIVLEYGLISRKESKHPASDRKNIVSVFENTFKLYEDNTSER